MESFLTEKESNKLRIAYFAGTMRPGHDGVTRVLYKVIEELNRRKIENIFFSPISPIGPIGLISSQNNKALSESSCDI